MSELYDLALAQNGRGVLFTRLSAIQGYGLFTGAFLPENTILCRCLGLRSTLPLMDKRVIIGIDGIDRENHDGSIFKNINHSCHPNTWLTDTGCLVNFKDIVHGEEITIDYCALLPGSDWQTPCLCGEAACCRIIKSME